MPAKRVNFDKDNNGKPNDLGWMTDEMATIRDACKDDGYDYNLFLVDKPTYSGALGFMDFNQRYAYINADNCKHPEMTIAHELGHGAFGLEHKNSDSDNVMSQGDSLSKWRLRKDQWDEIQR